MLSRFSIIITENILTDYWNLTIWFDLTQSPLTRVEHSWIWRIGFVVGPCEGHACSLLLVSDRMKSHAHPLCHEELEMAMEAWRNWMADCLCVVLERIKKKKLSFFMPSASAEEKQISAAAIRFRNDGLKPWAFGELRATGTSPHGHQILWLSVHLLFMILLGWQFGYSFLSYMETLLQW